MVFVEG